MRHFGDWVVIAGSVAGSLTAIGLLVLALWRPTTRLWARLGRAFDIIIGTPEERDPLSGAVLRPAVPDMGTRVSNLESAIAADAAGKALRLAQQAVEEVAQLRSTVGELKDRVDEWQSVDRRQADTMRAALTEVGLDVDLPIQTEAHRGDTAHR